MSLLREIDAARTGSGEPARLLGEFRRAVVLVPVLDGALMSAVLGGVRWVYSFTDEEALARFAAARGSVAEAEWEFLAVLGARLLDAVVPTLDGPTGVAVNVADEDGSMMFPPVQGIVPDSVAVDGEATR
ncbi:hypothetical protein [Streptomyces sp. SYSU K217416]